MTFEKFKELTDLMISANKKLSDADSLGLDAHEFCADHEHLINLLWDSLLTDHGIDWFNWFMYEKKYIYDGVGDPTFTAHDDDLPICRDLGELYEYLTKSNYFKIKVEDAKSSN